jgi:DNA-binding MarR family transcriptional regulator
MSQIFIGDLSQVKLFDILKPLLMGKKTGKLSFQGKESGEMYLELGNIVHAKTPNSFGEYGFFAIMGWKAGRITFEPDEPPPERTISIPSEQLFLNWSSKKMDWERIREVIPSNSAVFRLCLQRNGENKNISTDQWNVLALSNGMRTISEIAKTLNWDESKTMSMTYQLIQAGLLERAEVQKPLRKKLAGETFFLTVENELKKVMGPVAPFVIEDKLSEFGETKDSLPQDQKVSFVESLGEEIPNDLKRKEFIKVMMESLSLLK